MTSHHFHFKQHYHVNPKDYEQHVNHFHIQVHQISDLTHLFSVTQTLYLSTTRIQFLWNLCNLCYCHYQAFVRSLAFSIFILSCLFFSFLYLPPVISPLPDICLFCNLIICITFWICLSVVKQCSSGCSQIMCSHSPWLFGPKEVRVTGPMIVSLTCFGHCSITPLRTKRYTKKTVV